MTRLVLVVAAVLGLSELAPARAQFYAPGYGYSYSYRSGFGFSFGGPNFRVKGFAGGFVTRSAFVAPPVFVGPVAPFGPVGFAPIGFRPLAPVGFGNPYLGGWGPAFGGFGGFGPPVVAVPVPIPVFVGGNLPDPNGGAANDAVPFPKVARPGDFLVIAPRRDIIPEVPRVADVRPPAPILFDPFATPVAVEVPDVDPKKEAARLMKLGRAAFAAGDYGRAAEHFERASTADADDAVTYFLHGQARFAAGQYAAAAARIRDGLARDPKWPVAAFNPTEMYGDKPERFVVHLTELKKAVADNPGQVTLEFVLGYQLWYSGDKVEADKLFRAAEARLLVPGPIALFKLP